jgi:hypothetical protein
MRPVSVFANGPASEIERLQACLRGPWRQAARAVMVLLSLHGLTAAQIAALLDCQLAVVRRFDREGMAGLAPGAGGSGWAGYEQNLWNALRYASQIRPQGALSDPDLVEQRAVVIRGYLAVPDPGGDEHRC